VRRAAELMRDHAVARLVVVDGSDVVGVVSRHDVLKALLRTDAEIQASLNRLLAEQGEIGVTATVEWGIAALTGRMSTRRRVADLLSRVEAIDGVLGVESDLTCEVDDVLPPALPMM
jgi:CBS domain-containing protein